MIRGPDVVEARIGIIENIKLRAAFEPEIIRFAGMEVERSVVPQAIRSHGQKCAVYVRAILASLNVHPIMIFKQNDEDRLHSGEAAQRPAIAQIEWKRAAAGGNVVRRAGGILNAAHSQS